MGHFTPGPGDLWDHETYLEERRCDTGDDWPELPESCIECGARMPEDTDWWDHPLCDHGRNAVQVCPECGWMHVTDGRSGTVRLIEPEEVAA